MPRTKKVVPSYFWWKRDAILDQSRRPRLEKMDIDDFFSPKVKFYRNWDAIGEQIRRTRLKSQNLCFPSRESEILVPTSVNLVGFLIVFGEKSIT